MFKTGQLYQVHKERSIGGVWGPDRFHSYTRFTLRPGDVFVVNERDDDGNWVTVFTQHGETWDWIPFLFSISEKVSP